MDRGFSFSISGKSFNLSSLGKSLFLLIESSGKFTSTFKIDGNNLQWLCKALIQASLQQGNKCRRWGKKVQAYTFRVIQNFNSYNRFMRIKTTFGNKKHTVIIPEGSYNKSLEQHSTEDSEFSGSLPRPKVPSLCQYKSRSFKEAPRISN